nr:immunoglobulin heavy chain junction region [Macaca mulatta]MOX58980.1 immunoglobulin heavy chain junction region [Macaca mulatta]MOX59290.1 immunoglobulin heavy chain junction region [Macaca mulatta]MOX59430.1 immunoglobulin heavy chain junction region [Macaca mulatta]MOX60176.1 immunoglobulin heavy chain junction region [Macaca mulatta]
CAREGISASGVDYW